MAKLLIRADADSHIGAGHVMRMIALARAWNTLGGECLFVTASCPDGLVARISAEGIAHRGLGVEAVGAEEDQTATVRIVEAFAPDWIALDGYQFREDYCEELFGKGPKLMVMDDYGYCDLWFADVIVNQNYGAARWGERGQPADPRTEWLLGTQYVLLRQEFRASSAAAKPKARPWRRVLVTLGGADDRNATGKAMEALEEADHPPLHVRVLVSPTFPHRASLDGLAANSKHEVEVMTLVQDMPSMLLWADAIVSAGGSTCWEWLAHGLSGAVLTVAENQVQIARDLSDSQLAVHLGSLKSFERERWGLALGSWLRGEAPEADFDRRRSVVDGLGAERLVRRLMAKP